MAGERGQLARKEDSNGFFAGKLPALSGKIPSLIFLNKQQG